MFFADISQRGAVPAPSRNGIRRQGPLRAGAAPYTHTALSSPARAARAVLRSIKIGSAAHDARSHFSRVVYRDRVAPPGGPGEGSAKGGVRLRLQRVWRIYWRRRLA